MIRRQLIRAAVLEPSNYVCSSCHAKRFFALSSSCAGAARSPTVKNRQVEDRYKQSQGTYVSPIRQPTSPVRQPTSPVQERPGPDQKPLPYPEAFPPRELLQSAYRNGTLGFDDVDAAIRVLHAFMHLGPRPTQPDLRKLLDGSLQISVIYDF